MPKGPFDDELTPEEEALIQNDTALPPDAETDEENSVDRAVEEAAAPSAIPPKEGEQPPAEEEPKPGEPAAQQPPADTAPTQEEIDADEKALREFLEKHKDKTPEEIARLAVQQSKRANRAEQQNRAVRERVGALAERARQAQEARQQVHSSIPEMKAKFREKLATDPDGAVAELFDALADQRLQQADDEVTAARIDEAIVFADAHIPNFSEQWPGMHGLAREVGYSDEELNAIDDPRPLIILSLANHTARLMKAGIMDRMGNIVNAPQVEAQPLDPRLAAPDPQRTLSGGARSARSNASMADQLNEILAMTPEQFDKFDRENPGAIESLLKAA